MDAADDYVQGKLVWAAMLVFNAGQVLYAYCSSCIQACVSQ